MWGLLGVLLILLAVFWPRPLYVALGLGDRPSFTQERFRRSRRVNRALARVATGLLGLAFLAHVVAPLWFPRWSLWLQVIPFCSAWLVLLAMLGVIAWFGRLKQ